MNSKTHTLLPQSKNHFRTWFAVLAVLVLIGGLTIFQTLAARAQAGDAGHRTFSFGDTYAPTSAETQSKLWFNDGTWWGILYNTVSGSYEIYRFNWNNNTWSPTGTVVDQRKTTRSDSLWDGAHLYIVSGVRTDSIISDKSAVFKRYSYNAGSKSYSLDGGFPVTVSNTPTYSISLDKDSNGQIWITYIADNGSGASSVYVAHTTTNDSNWVAPYVLPAAGASNLLPEELSSIVAYNQSIGIMWSNKTDHTIYFANHVNGEPDNVWQVQPALQGHNMADFHLSLKSVRSATSSEVFAVVKTSRNNFPIPNPLDPLIVFLQMDRDGNWTGRTFSRVADRHTRPLLMIDEEHRLAYIFATIPYPDGEAIYYKSISLDNTSTQFTPGMGIPFIQLSTDHNLNNATSSKQPLNSQTGLLVLAEDGVTTYYVHNTTALTGSEPPPTEPPDGTPSGTPTIVLLPFISGGK
jgi:hypothetical protein